MLINPASGFFMPVEKDGCFLASSSEILYEYELLSRLYLTSLSRSFCRRLVVQLNRAL